MRVTHSTVFMILLASLLTTLSLSAHALDKEPFTQARFESLQEQGEVILVDVYASWCPTCAKQQEILTTYQENNPEKSFHVLVVDFDKDKDIVRQFRAPRQSTLLLYKGKEQFWFSVAETRKDIIAAELDKAIAFERKQ